MRVFSEGAIQKITDLILELRRSVRGVDQVQCLLSAHAIDRLPVFVRQGSSLSGSFSCNTIIVLHELKDTEGDEASSGERGRVDRSNEHVGLVEHDGSFLVEIVLIMTRVKYVRAKSL